MNNKTCLLTGGSRGIGKATVDLLRGKGWEVVAPTRAELDFDDGGISVDSFSSDPVDVVVFCHGEWYAADVFSQEKSDWARQYYSRVIYPVLLANEICFHSGAKCVIFVSSTRGFIGGINTAPYSAACAAQISVVQGYAREQKEVRWNCVCPGLTDTDMGQEVIRTGGAKPDAPMQPPGVVAAEIVRLIESNDNGRVMRVVNSEVSEAKWSW